MSKELQTEQEPAASTGAKRIRLSTRQPLSTLGKIAAWSFLTATLAGVGGTVTLAITSGAPSPAIITFTVVCLAATILVTTGIRWLQVIAALLGVFSLYLQFVQPFVIESLTNPRGDPHGGYGHFIGNVFLIAITMIACVACAGAVVQDYRRVSRKFPRWFTSVLGGILGLVIGASFIGAVAQPPPVAVLTYTNGVPTVHMGAGNFDLSSVTIAKGSKLLLVDDTSEQHVLANGTWQNGSPVQKREPGAPLVNSLSLSGNRATIGPFNLAGTYHILCLIHRGMILTITVQ